MNLPDEIQSQAVQREVVPRRENLVSAETLLKHSVFLDKGQVRLSARPDSLTPIALEAQHICRKLVN